MKRISVSTLEKFRRYMNNVSSFDTEAALIESLTGTFTGNDKKKFGGAFHKLIELGTGAMDGLADTVDGVLFTDAHMWPAFEYRLNHPKVIHEVPASKIYDTMFGPIQVSARIDAIEGAAIRDPKTKYRDLGDLRDYSNSYQWRFYLDMAESEVFYYDHFEVIGFKGFIQDGDTFIVDPSVQIKAHDPLQCLAYANMQRDCLCLINEFLIYIHARGFEHYLKEANVTYEPVFIVEPVKK